MREIARVQQGFFPTQARIVTAVAGLFKLTAAVQGQLAAFDAGCGTGQAIHDLRSAWLAQVPTINVALLGIESVKDRYQKAASLFGTGNGGGTALWSAIEDAAVDH